MKVKICKDSDNSRTKLLDDGALIPEGWTQVGVAKKASSHAGMSQLIAHSLIHSHLPTYSLARSLTHSLTLTHARTHPRTRTCTQKEGKAKLLHGDGLSAGAGFELKPRTDGGRTIRTMWR